MAVRSDILARRIVILVVFLPCVFAGAADAQEANNAKAKPVSELGRIEQQLQAILPQMRKSTVAIRCGRKSGSGIVVAAGKIITALHVVSTKETIRFAIFDGEKLGSFQSAELMDASKEHDFALLKYSQGSAQSPPARLEVSKADEAGAICFGLGFTDGKSVPYLRFGHVSKTNGSFVYSTCLLAEGDSGGPLFFPDGTLAGMHLQRAQGSNRNRHLNATVIRRLLKAQSIPIPVSRRDGGVTTNQVASAETELQRLNRKSIFQVTGQDRSVCLATAIHSSGILATKLSELPDAKSVELIDAEGTKQLAKIIVKFPPHDLAFLKVDHEVRAVSLPDASSLDVGTFVRSVLPKESKLSIVSNQQEHILHSGSRLGIEFFPDSVRIKSVRRNSASSRAGLRADDLLLSFDGQSIQKIAQLQTLLKDAEPGDRILLRIQRDSGPMAVSIVLGHTVEEELRTAKLPLSQRRTGVRGIFLHDGDVKPHLCGGPVFNRRGEFVGINIGRIRLPQTAILPSGILDTRLQETLGSAIRPQ